MVEVLFLFKVAMSPESYGKQKSRKNSKPAWLSVVIALVVCAIFLYDYLSAEGLLGFETSHSSGTSEAKQGSVEECVDALYVDLQGCLEGHTYDEGSAPYVELNESSVTNLDVTSTKVGLDYSNLDSLNRAGRAYGILNQDNLGKSEGRDSQVWKPAGFQNQALTIDGKKTYPYNRGHLVPYTATFNLDIDGNYSPGEDGSLDNPKNLSTQTTYTNQTLFTMFERVLRDNMAEGEYFYSVSPVYIGEELVPRGYWISGKPLSGGGDVMNVYAWNVMDGVSLDYNTGKAVADDSVEVPEADAYVSN